SWCCSRPQSESASTSTQSSAFPSRPSCSAFVGSVSLLDRGATTQQRDVTGGICAVFSSQIPIAKTSEFSVKQPLSMRERGRAQIVFAHALATDGPVCAAK